MQSGCVAHSASGMHEDAGQRNGVCARGHGMPALDQHVSARLLLGEGDLTPGARMRCPSAESSDTSVVAAMQLLLTNLLCPQVGVRRSVSHQPGHMQGTPSFMSCHLVRRMFLGVSLSGSFPPLPVCVNNSAPVSSNTHTQQTQPPLPCSYPHPPIPPPLPPRS